MLHSVTGVNWRESLETQTKEARSLLGSEDARQREKGMLTEEDGPLPPQHHRETVVYGFSKEPRHQPKMEGELSVVRLKPSEKANFPVLRVKKDAL